MERCVFRAVVIATCLACLVHSSSAASSYRRPFLIEIDDPENFLDMISRLGRSVARNNDFEYAKRGVDFGMGRGFSGTQAAKHLMGLAAANYAVGPGRKRRDISDESVEVDFVHQN